MAADGFERAPLGRLTRTLLPDPMVLASALADAAAKPSRMKRPKLRRPRCRP